MLISFIESLLDSAGFSYFLADQHMSAVEGSLGFFFSAFRNLDAPHNLFPSLHIALCALLAYTYTRRSQGFLKRVLQIWFFFIGASAVLTQQHHLVDVAGGLMLAGFAFYCFRESGGRLPVTRNVRVGCYYAAAGRIALR